MRYVSWFSCGAASAVSSKLLLAAHPDALIVRCVVVNEHADNDRFAKECETWFGKEVINIRSEKYEDCWQVWKERRYLNGPAGALCTVEMKKKVRQNFQLPDDVQAFGFTADEKDRANRFIENNLEVNAVFPLIGTACSKDDCFKILMNANIDLPEMYRLGYNNANCVGCVKGGKGYWNKIRIDFPETFNRMSEQEETLGASCINGTFLKDLDPTSGRHKSIELPECGLTCEPPRRNRLEDLW